MARKKDTPQKAALREMMGNYLKENNVKVKDAVFGHDGYYKKMDRPPTGLGADSFAAGDFL